MMIQIMLEDDVSKCALEEALRRCFREKMRLSSVFCGVFCRWFPDVFRGPSLFVELKTSLELVTSYSMVTIVKVITSRKFHLEQENSIIES